ncbi:hypothetical protein BDZ91DRAFT_763607 [Kalaharituber pfeilii]|nr:hypothetical protein BDZ91DRAFT_763607 [Kalaharituber pfeilii]
MQPKILIPFFIAAYAVSFAGRAFALPVPNAVANANCNVLALEPTIATNCGPFGITTTHQLKAHGQLEKREDAPVRGTSPDISINIAAPESPITDISAEAADKPSFLKSVAQGLSKFFKAVKNWFKSGDKAEAFKNLGRKFSNWFKQVKARITGISNKPVETETEEATVISSPQIGDSVVEVEGSAPTAEGQEDIAAIAEQNARLAAERSAAERKIKKLHSESDDLFDSDENQAGNGNGYDMLANRDHDRLRKLGSGYRSPITSESGPPRGNVGTFSNKAAQVMTNLETLQKAGWVKDHVPAKWDEGVRPDPNALTPTEALFLEQGLDPTKLSRKDRRNYQILLEWYKDQKKVHDVTHPQHHELYDKSPPPPPQKWLWGTDVYYAQQDDPHPIPRLIEGNKEISALEKLGSYFTYGFLSNDPNRPKFWYNNLPGMSRDNEVEQWISENIPASWIDKHFPLSDGPRTKQYFSDALTAQQKNEMVDQLNEATKAAAERRNKNLAKTVHGDALEWSNLQAMSKGDSQYHNYLNFPTAEQVYNDRELLERLREETYERERKLGKLKMAKKMHKEDEERLGGRLREEGVVVVE